MIYWLFARKWTMFFIILCSFFVCWKPITHYIPVHLFQPDITGKNVLKVLSYNVMAFGYQNHTTNKPNPIIQYIADSDADIVCLQEYMVAKQANFLTREKVEQALNMYPYHYTEPLVRKSNYSIGLAIFSKFPILNSRKINYDSTFNGSTVHEIDVKGKKMIVINNHLESFKLTMEDRSNYADFLKNMNQESFDELKETVQHKLSTAFKIRAEQVEIVADEIRNLKGDYLIVCGDFNDTPISYAYQTIKGSLVDAFATSGNGPGITYNHKYYWFRIDHILHSHNMKAHHAKVDQIPVSDHFPIWGFLEMK
ncbi:MAG: endonuclease/exonuclease/phosphatase family protein [Tannerella sp.]|nr:endonuclease/exonuclease/phosphatase family protein [Tannerella sp.]